MNEKYWGKYRAIVTNNNDPMNMGRVKVKCPYVLGDYESTWCMPCIPFLSEENFIFRKPIINETLWVEFENGELSKPIWVGGWVKPNTFIDTENDIFYMKGTLTKI